MVTLNHSNKMSKNIILSSLKESFSVIWKKKLLFLLIFFIQILFFSALFYISLVYQTKIYESTKAISDYMQQQKLDDITVAKNIINQKNILGDDPLSISRNFNNLIINFRLYLIYTFIALIVSMPLLWAMTEKFFSHISLKYFFNNLIIVFGYLILIFIFFYSLTNISFSGAAQTFGFALKYLIFLILSVVLFYFMYISLSLARNTELKDIITKTLKIGIKKMHYILAVYFINFILVVLSVFLLIYFVDTNFAVVVMAILMFMFSIIFGRIFMLSVVNKLENL